MHLFWGRERLSTLDHPWCTYTDPEIAHVGLYVTEAIRRGIPVKTFTVPMHDVDRAIADGEEEGFVKIHVERRHRQNSRRYRGCSPRWRDDQRYLACDRFGNRPPRSSPCHPSLSNASRSNQDGGGFLQQDALDALSQMAVEALAGVVNDIETIAACAHAITCGMKRLRLSVIGPSDSLTPMPEAF